MKIAVTIDLKVGRVVKYFIYADLALLAGWGLLEPIFAVFVVDHIAGATVITVGTSAAIYWLLKSGMQIPLSKYFDRKKGENDDFHGLILGLLIAALTAFSFGLIHEIWQLYLVQAFHALAFALYTATWPAIFSRHLDKDKISFDWALDSTAAGLSAGVSGFLGGVAAAKLGFNSVFVLAAVFSALAAFILIFTPDLVLPPKTSTEPSRQDHTPTTLGV